MKKEDFTDIYHSRIEEGVKGDRLRLLAYPDGSVMKRGREEAAEYKAQTATTTGTGASSSGAASTATVNKFADDGLGGTFTAYIHTYMHKLYTIHKNTNFIILHTLHYSAYGGGSAWQTVSVELVNEAEVEKKRLEDEKQELIESKVGYDYTHSSYIIM